MELLILFALLVVSVIVIGYLLMTKTFGAAAIASSIFIFIGLMVLSGGIQYTDGSVTTSYDTIDLIDGVNTTVTHTSETDVKASFSGQYANGISVLLIFFGIIIIFGGALQVRGASY